MELLSGNGILLMKRFIFVFQREGNIVTFYTSRFVGSAECHMKRAALGLNILEMIVLQCGEPVVMQCTCKFYS